MSQPRSPRHYDKYTYSTRRKPESETTLPVGSAFSPNRPKRRSAEAYDACVAGVAPLLRNSDGFAIGEDGTVQSKFVSAPRYSMPQIALVPIPMTVIPTAKSPTGSAPIAVPRAAVVGLQPSLGTPEYEAWQRFSIKCSNDFTGEELGNLNWDTIIDLMRHYNFTNPVDQARIQLAWKRKQGILHSDIARSNGFGDPSQQNQADAPSFYVPASVPRHAASPLRNKLYDERIPSPRRSPKRFTPYVHGTWKTDKYDNVRHKVDDGIGPRRGPRVTSPSPIRSGRPTSPSSKIWR